MGFKMFIIREIKRLIKSYMCLFSVYVEMISNINGDKQTSEIKNIA